MLSRRYHAHVHIQQNVRKYWYATAFKTLGVTRNYGSTLVCTTAIRTCNSVLKLMVYRTKKKNMSHCVAKVVNEKGSILWLYIELAEVVSHKTNKNDNNVVPNLVEMQGTWALSVRGTVRGE